MKVKSSLFDNLDDSVYKKFDRFDFEQQIMQCWHVTDDIRTVTEYLLDAPLEVDREDKIANMLMGIEALYNAKFDKLFSQFESLVHEHSRTLDRDLLSDVDGDLGTQTGMDSTTDPAYGASYADEYGTIPIDLSYNVQQEIKF